MRTGFSSMDRRRLPSRIGARRAFTLLELMMVVAIIGLVMAMGIPAMLSITHEAPLRKGVNDILEICARTRAQAILQNQTTTITFFPLTKEISTGVAVDAAQPSTRLGNPAVTSTKLGEGVEIAMLDVNLSDFGASEQAQVHFYPNGTCDELTIVLFSSGDYRKISLEPTTALARAESIK